MEKLSVKKTRKLDLCVSCEICSAICPENAITMEYEFGQFLPIVDDEKCMKCGLCLELCPGIDLDPLNFRYNTITTKMLEGDFLESYTAFSYDLRIRKNSTSGGLITNLVTALIKNKDFSSAFILDFDNFNGKPARLKTTNEVSEIFKTAKSKYVPVSVYNVIKTLLKRDKRQFIIVGTPCQIYGIKKFNKKFNISEENLLFLGIFCDKTLNFNLIRYFETNHKKPNERLLKFEYRTKEKYGWPGHSKIYFDSGREIIIDRKDRIQLKPYFQLNRCLFCYDKLNQFADISFGDCHIIGKSDFDGKSSVIIRTEKGKDLFEKYSHLFYKEKENQKRIRESQHLRDKLSNLEYAKVFIKKTKIFPDSSSDFKFNKKAEKTLSKLQKYIWWGKNYNINKIKFSLFLLKIKNKLKITGKIRVLGKTILLGINTIINSIYAYYRRKKTVSRTRRNGNVIIIGGELFNKGAQAMTFTVVDQIKKRFPNKSIFLFSRRDFDREEKDKSIFTFNILPFDDLNTKMRILGFLNRYIRRSNYNLLENEIIKVIENADFFIDISGYALSSQWETYRSFNYILNILIAKKFSIPYYIFPQSIGPFDYPFKYKILLFPLFKLFLKYPSKIFPREKEGLMHLRKFTKKNVQKKYDIVLQNEEYNLSNIYRKNLHFKVLDIEQNAVCIIPNLKVIERTDPTKIYLIYKHIIKRLLDAKKKIYILSYANEDIEVCEKIGRLFPDNKVVRLISHELNCIELENTIKQFEFIITSRYHSIINAYKNGVPTLVIGWATKYFELLENFGQLDYFFDVRDLDIDRIKLQMNKLLRDYELERVKIINKMNDLRKENIFSIFGVAK